VREYSWRFAKSVSGGLVRSTRRNEVLEHLHIAGPSAVYAGLLMYAQTHHKRDGSPYDPGWAAHSFKEIYGTWPRPQDRRVEPKALPNFLIEEWAAGRKRKPRPSLPLFDACKQ
jgi:hypothetical protein